MLFQGRIFDSTGNDKIEKRVLAIEEKFRYFVETRNIDDCSCAVIIDRHGENSKYIDLCVCGNFEHRLSGFLDIIVYIVRIGNLIADGSKSLKRCFFYHYIARRESDCWTFESVRGNELSVPRNLMSIKDFSYLYRCKYGTNSPHELVAESIKISSLTTKLTEFFLHESDLYDKIINWKRHAEENKKYHMQSIMKKIEEKYPKIDIKERDFLIWYGLNYV